MSGLSIRRHHKNRIKNKVKNYYGGVHRNNPRYLGIATETQKPCSCYMCGNPRKHFNKDTIQEKIHNIDFELTSE